MSLAPDDSLSEPPGSPDPGTSEDAEDSDAPRPERAEETYEGLKEIAAALGVSVKTVVRLATRDYDPLPLRYDFLQRAYIFVAALKSWINRQDLPAHAYHELHRIGRLPGQIKLAGRAVGTPKPRSAVQRARLTKVAKRQRHSRPARGA